MYLPNVPNHRNFLFILSSFNKHAKIKHAARAIIKFNDHICIIDYVGDLQHEINNF
jgi:hypothetical protein